jgi:hypothetical protein
LKPVQRRLRTRLDTSEVLGTGGVCCAMVI